MMGMQGYSGGQYTPRVSRPAPISQSSPLAARFPAIPSAQPQTIPGVPQWRPWGNTPRRPAQTPTQASAQPWQSWPSPVQSPMPMQPQQQSALLSALLGTNRRY